MAEANLEQRTINTIRTLSMDAVEAAKSGHPGTPMALAPVTYLLFKEFLRYDPDMPHWMGRDRFVLSCGHASMLLYATLHLAGVRQVGPDGQSTEAVSLEDIRRFRQLNSRCPGHPEFGHTAGVETTTGPLGQGVANSVGIAIAARWLTARYNRPGFKLFDSNIYALCGDGDMMEGVSAEAASLAGHLQLSNLCWIYDDNKITIEGHTSLAFSEDVQARFEGYGWDVVRVDDVNNLDALRLALKRTKENHQKPTLIIVRSVIAWGAPNKHNTHGAHGAPLGEEEIRLTKAAYGWPIDEHFLVPVDVKQSFHDAISTRGQQLRKQWESLFAQYQKQFPEQAQQIAHILDGTLPDGWDCDLKPFPADAKGMATRVSSGKVLNQIAQNLPWMVGGSADLAPSNNTALLFDGAGDLLTENPGGRNMHFGIREHAMGSILNGMAVSGLRAFGATFFVFSDYMRPAMRMAALMQLPILYVFTHDSIGVGEDGPTHQPVEHLAAARSIPNLAVFRPADANEVTECYRAAFTLLPKTPSCMVLTRQNLPTLDRTQYAPASGASRGGYILIDAPNSRPQVILIGTGSEVPLCIEAHKQLAAEGIAARVVSLPCWELFDAQPADYRQSVLLADVTARVGVEMGVELGWQKYIGCRGRFVGMKSFGASAPADVLLKHFGFTTAHVVAEAKAAIQS